MMKKALLAIPLLALMMMVSCGDSTTQKAEPTQTDPTAATDSISQAQADNIKETGTDTLAQPDAPQEPQASAASEEIDDALDEFQSFISEVKRCMDDGIPGSSTIAMRAAEKSDELHERLNTLKQEMTPQQQQRFDQLDEEETRLFSTWE